MPDSMLALDGSVSPYLPTDEMLAEIASAAGVERDPAELAVMLRDRLALLHGVSAARIALFPHDENRLKPLAALRPGRPWVHYTPVARELDRLAHDVEWVTVERSDRFRIEAEQVVATPAGSIALVMTPNDPTGNVLSIPTAAQLAGRTKLLVLDERSAEMQRRSMIPLVEELESIVLLRSFADWAGIGACAPGYAITTVSIAAAIDRPAQLHSQGIVAALAAVSHASKLDAIAHRVRLERLRLFRMLRKLNLLAPLPSDAGYVLAKVTRGDRDTIARELADRGIAVHAPEQARLAETLRFAAISPAATSQLQRALIEISRTIDA